MEELVLVLGSVAGACTAVAMDKIPKRKIGHLSLGTNPIIKNQIQSLKIEKEILTKTISRLYQQESDLSKIQRDKLLLRYQHHLGLVIAKIEKLEAASKHPDLGPLGDGLMTLMDQKLSQLDQRLHEISSKITVTSTSPIKQPEPIKEIVQEKIQPKKVETKIETQKEVYVPMPPIEVSIPEKHRSVELITLTEIPNKPSEFPAELIKPPVVAISKQSVEQVKDLPVQPEKPKVTEIEPIREKPHQEIVPLPAEKKIQIPDAIKIPEEEKIEEDDKDLDKIKSEIMKALSKLEQVEVE